MNADVKIGINNRDIGCKEPPYIIAEMSANHNGDYHRAVDTVHAAKEAGADAIKLQTYTADTMTLDCDKEWFQVKGGTLWDGYTLYRLYQEAHMPWDWQPRLKEAADKICITLFSTPFDKTAVDFLEEMRVPAYKIASFEVVDIPLLEKIASTGKPVIMSTGMANLAEIEEAVCTLRGNGCRDIVLLKCVSSYPAVPEEMNLRTIPHLAEAFQVPAGLSDHTLGIAVPIAAVALGACVVEKHFTLSRKDKGPDSEFSLEPAEFREMVENVKIAKSALGEIKYELTSKEKTSRVFRRSLFVSTNMKRGDVFTEKNIRSIRPGNGLAVRNLSIILGHKAAADISAGTPVSWDIVS